MLKVEHATVTFGTHAALHDVDLTVADGQVVCVLGPSGCGKSTLLRAIAGLDPLASGRVTWDAEDLAGTPPHQRRFGLMFQDHALFPHRDVLGNVAFGLRMQHLDRDAVNARSRAALERVGLEGFAHRPIAELSGGEQQRVALARALAPEPRLLMLDEPLGALDRPLRERLVVELHELFDALEVTALFVTHDQDEAFSLADRVVLLHEGEVEQDDSPEVLWQHPATEVAARFLGCTNVTDAEVRGRVVKGAWGTFALTGSDRDGVVRIATRPDAFRLSVDGPLVGTVLARTFRRDHVLVRVQLDSPAGSSADPVEAAVPVADSTRIGASIRLAIDPNAVIILA